MAEINTCSRCKLPLQRLEIHLDWTACVAALRDELAKKEAGTKDLLAAIERAGELRQEVEAELRDVQREYAKQDTVLQVQTKSLLALRAALDVKLNEEQGPYATSAVLTRRAARLDKLLKGALEVNLKLLEAWQKAHAEARSIKARPRAEQVAIICGVLAENFQSDDQTGMADMIIRTASDAVYEALMLSDPAAPPARLVDIHCPCCGNHFTNPRTPHEITCPHCHARLLLDLADAVTVSVHGRGCLRHSPGKERASDVKH